MPNAAQVEAHLRAHALPIVQDLLPADAFVMPHYDGLGVANVPATIAALFGQTLPGNCPPLQRDLWADWREGLKRIVLIVVDALGYLQLREAMAADEGLVFHRLAQAGRLVPITSTFPSTTNTVLSSLWTGYSPAAHGMIAYALYLRELGVAASALFFWPVHYRKRDVLGEWGVEPEKFLPVPGLAEQLRALGISARAYISQVYAQSILSQMHGRGVEEIRSFVAMSDMWLGLQRTIQEHSFEKLLLVGYWDTMDGITHQYGPDDESWAIELRAISQLIEEGFLAGLKPEHKDGTLLLFLADHGGVTTPPEVGVRLDQHPALQDALSLPPLGEPRTPFLHARGDSLVRLQAYVEEKLGHAFVTLTREQVLQSGLLGPGPVYSETPHRLGDLVCIARGDHYLAHTKNSTLSLGRHGGLSAREMLIPWLGVRLDWM